MLASCTAEEAVELESPKDSDTPRIVVFGGSTAPGVTRAEETIFHEPSNIGICNADKLKILSFKGTKTSGSNITAGNLKLLDNAEEIEISNNLNYRDKWTSHSMSVLLDGSQDNWFAFPAIAYNSKDEDKFSFPLETNNPTYNNLKLNIQSATTDSEIDIPELYFGRLTPSGKDYESNNLRNAHEAENMVYKYSYKASWETESDNLQLEGKLYRIVSQLNINISEVSTSVEKIEMYLSNVPTQIGLYAPHRSELGKEGKDRGYYYPIVEASGNGQHITTETGILVCTVTNKDFTDGTAKLSTFLLPSDRGRSVTVKAYIKSAEVENVEKSEEENTEKSKEEDEEKSDEEIVWKTIERARTLRASQSYSLDEATSKVYFSSTELPVYNAATSEFMSYPNVRVNVYGKLSEIFSEESDTNVKIEICPYYDGLHTIEIK